MHNPDIPAPMMATLSERFSDTVTPCPGGRMAEQYAAPRRVLTELTF